MKPRSEKSMELYRLMERRGKRWRVPMRRGTGCGRRDLVRKSNF